MILITKILDRIQKFQDVKIYIQEGVIKTIELINKWADKGEILAIIRFDGNAIREDFNEDIDN